MIQILERNEPKLKRLGEKLQLVESLCERLRQDGEREILSLLKKYGETIMQEIEKNEMHNPENIKENED